MTENETEAQTLALHPTPNPTPYTLHPTPYTLHPAPSTRHPGPYTSWSSRDFPP